jgi:hypothetical protein
MFSPPPSLRVFAECRSTRIGAADVFEKVDSGVYHVNESCELWQRGERRILERGRRQEVDEWWEDEEEDVSDEPLAVVQLLQYAQPNRTKPRRIGLTIGPYAAMLFTSMDITIAI